MGQVWDAVSSRLRGRWDARIAAEELAVRRANLQGIADRATIQVTSEAEAVFPCSTESAWRLLTTVETATDENGAFEIALPGPGGGQVGHRSGTVRPEDGVGLVATIREVVTAEPGRLLRTRSLTSLGRNDFEVHLHPLAPDSCRVRLVALDDVAPTDTDHVGRQVEHLHLSLAKAYATLIGPPMPPHLADRVTVWELGRAGREQAARARMDHVRVPLRVSATVVVDAPAPAAWSIARDPRTQALNRWADGGDVFVVPGDPARGVLERWAVERTSPIDTILVAAVELIDDEPGRRFAFRGGMPAERRRTTVVVDDASGPATVTVTVDVFAVPTHVARARAFWQEATDRYAERLRRRISDRRDLSADPS